MSVIALLEAADFSVKDLFVKAAWFVYGDGERFSKTSTVLRDDNLTQVNTETGNLGFFFVLVGREVSDAQVVAVGKFAETVTRYMNGLSDESAVGNGNRHSILSRIHRVCRDNALNLIVANDDLPDAFRSQEGRNRRFFVFEPAGVN